MLNIYSPCTIIKLPHVTQSDQNTAIDSLIKSVRVPNLRNKFRTGNIFVNYWITIRNNTIWIQVFRPRLNQYVCPLRYYRPQRSWATVIFSQACVCPQGERGVCLSACWDTHPPVGTDHPPGSRHPHRTRHTPCHGPGTPPLGTDTPPEQTPPPGTRHTTPWTRQTPREADCSIWLTSGRYASYWNAF